MKYIVAALLVLILGAGIAAVFLQKPEGTIAPGPVETQPVQQTETQPETTARRLRNVETFLIMGLDKYQAPVDEMGYLNDQQSDFLMLMILDREQKTCDFLHLNRDTMTPIQRLGIGGGKAGSFTGQLALAHTFGSGGSDSCINAVKAVSNLLGGIHIDHYVTMTMETLGVLNDLVGGVTVELMDDFTHLDPSFVKGAEVRLCGDQALSYVRSRSSLEDSSNLHRMERQRQYLGALFERLQQVVREDPEFTTRALRDVFIYMYSDCSLQQLNDLGKTAQEFVFHPIESIPGEAVQGEEFMEFYPDEEGLQAVIGKLFYE